MKRTPIFAISLVVLVLLLWLPACQSPDGPDSTGSNLLTREENPNLDDPYGGYNLGDEPAAFDDPVLMSEFSGEEEPEYDDSFEHDSYVQDVERRCSRRFFLRITWGNLERDSSVTFVTDWSGSLTVDNGVAVLKRVIRFEPRDRILPRTRPDLIEWISHTGPSFDGVLVKIVPVGIPDMMSPPNDSSTVMTFSTGPLTISFTLAELRDIHTIIPVDDFGNAVSFDAIYIDRNECPKGFLGGVWKKVPGKSGGVFFGKWVSETGMAMGHLKGIFGVSSDGQRLFFGKYIDMTGRFQGIVLGRYGYEDGSQNQGYFAGVWLDRNLFVRGELKGVWKTSAEEEGRGFFRGRWRMRCRNVL